MLGDRHHIYHQIAILGGRALLIWKEDLRGTRLYFVTLLIDLTQSLVRLHAALLGGKVGPVLFLHNGDSTSVH